MRRLKEMTSAFRPLWAWALSVGLVRLPVKTVAVIVALGEEELKKDHHPSLIVALSNES